MSVLIVAREKDFNPRAPRGARLVGGEAQKPFL